MKTFSQASSKPYPDAHRIIASQMTACRRALGPLGVGYQIQASLNTDRHLGIVDLYPIDFTGTPQQDTSILGRSVTVLDAPIGSIVVTTGSTPRRAYRTHRAIADWLDGGDSCDSFLDDPGTARQTSVEGSS